MKIKDNSLFFALIGLLLAATACRQEQKQPLSADDEGGIEVTITNTAGTSWTETGLPYLASPVNVAMLRGVPVLVLSDGIRVGKKVDVTVLGAVKLLEDGKKTNYIIAVPSKVNEKSIDINDFSDFVTVHSSAKWIVEQYLLSRNGLGSASLIAWEDEHYVNSKLLNQ